MKKIQYILAGTMLVSLSLGAQAQTQPQDTTMNRTVVVEQEYNPDIMDASKVNVLPRVEPPTVSKKAVEYDATLMRQLPLLFIPQRPPQPDIHNGWHGWQTGLAG